MYQEEDCLRHCLKLKTLLEDDLQEMENGLQGDLLDEYRQILYKEIEEMNQTIQNIQTLSN